VSPEWLAAVSSLATLFVIGLTAYAAMRQISHLRSGNQVAALLPLTEKYQTPEVQDSLDYVIGRLNSDLRDPAVRAGVIARPSAGPARQAKEIFNFYESVGALVCAHALDLQLVLRYFTLPSEMWETGGNFIALTRSTRGNEVFENFEALVAMQLAYEKRHGTSLYPRGLPRMSVPPLSTDESTAL
jgi:hypothetical protein